LKSITENIIEESAIEFLQSLGWQYANGKEISPEGLFCERESFEQIILTGRLRKAVTLLNPDIPESAREQAVQKVLRIYSQDLLHNNETFNATIDWTNRESARAKLMILVKRTLKKYGYPPDMQQKAIDTVMKQAELMADWFVSGS